MLTNQTRTVVGRMYSLYSKGQIEEAVASLAPDVDWAIVAPRSIFGFAGERRGRERVLDAFLEIRRDYEFLDYAPQTVIADGEHAAAHVRCVIRHRKTGHGANLDLCAVMRLEGGLVTWFREFLDSASAGIVMRTGELPV